MAPLLPFDQIHILHFTEDKTPIDIWSGVCTSHSGHRSDPIPRGRRRDRDETPSKSELTADQQTALGRISANSLRGHLSFLASDLLEGRDTPSRLDLAAEYIAAQFRCEASTVGDDGTSRPPIGRSPGLIPARSTLRFRMESKRSGSTRGTSVSEDRPISLSKNSRLQARPERRQRTRGPEDRAGCGEGRSGPGNALVVVEQTWLAQGGSRDRREPRPRGWDRCECRTTR